MKPFLLHPKLVRGEEYPCHRNEGFEKALAMMVAFGMCANTMPKTAFVEEMIEGTEEVAEEADKHVIAAE